MPNSPYSQLRLNPAGPLLGKLRFYNRGETTYIVKKPTVSQTRNFDYYK